MKPQLRIPALWQHCLTCKAEETLGADSQGPGAHRLDALQERSTDRAFKPKVIPKLSQGGLLQTCCPLARSLGSFQRSTEQGGCQKGSCFSALGSSSASKPPPANTKPFLDRLQFLLSLKSTSASLGQQLEKPEAVNQPLKESYLCSVEQTLLPLTLSCSRLSAVTEP